MDFRSIISGEARGIMAVLSRLSLSLMACFYRGIITLRNWFYDRGWLSSESLPVPVICIGNITAGGTGKTPMVIWLSRYLQERGRKVAVLSRGYKGGSDEDSDEVRLLRESLPDVTIVVDSDRLRGGRKAREQCQADVLLMDDGFQHRRLQRDLDIVLIDGSCPFGYGKMLPRGLLREPVGQLRRADAVVLTRSDIIPAEKRAELKQLIRKLLNDTAKPIGYSCVQPEKLYAADGSEIDGGQLQEKKVFIFGGIGNPGAFTATLKKMGAAISGEYFFSDHTGYDEKMVRKLSSLRENSEADWLVTTEKDWVKLRKLPMVSKVEQLYWLKISINITHNQEMLCEKINAVIHNKSN